MGHYHLNPSIYLFQNFSSFDFNDTYADIEIEEPQPRKRDHVEVASDVIKFCGIAFNGILFVLLVFGLARSQKQRHLPRIWLLMGLVVANLLTPSFALLADHLLDSDLVTTNHILCVLITNLPTCFDATSVLVSTLLGCHVFLWVYVPTAEKGRRTLLFLVIAVFVALAVSIAVVLVIRAPETEILVIDHFAPVKKFCMAYFKKETSTVLFSCIFLVLPFIFMLPIGLLSLWLNAGNIRRNAVELVPLPVTSQSNPEYFGFDPTKPDEFVPNQTLQRITDQNRGPNLLPWVLFNLMNVIIGFGLRLLGHLLLHKFFTEAVFDKTGDFAKEMKVWYVSGLCQMIYFCFVPILCMILPEIRKTLTCFCNIFKMSQTGNG